MACHLRRSRAWATLWCLLALLVGLCDVPVAFADVAPQPQPCRPIDIAAALDTTRSVLNFDPSNAFEERCMSREVLASDSPKPITAHLLAA